MNFYQSYQLSPLLRRYIDCVWVETFFEQPVNQNMPQLIIPDNSVELVFTQNMIERELKTYRELHKNRTHLSGLKTKPQQIKLNRSPLLCIRFKAHGLYRFTNVKASETVDQSLSPIDIFGKSFKALEEQLFEAKDIENRLTVVETYFHKRLIDYEYSQDHLFEILLQKINLAKGGRRIQSLAEEFGISIKTIERKFQNHIGVSPKTYSRLVRLFHTLQHLNFKEGPKLVDIVYQHGFYDQMHFIKEIKHFTGLSPTTYLQKDLGIQKPIFSQRFS